MIDDIFTRYTDAERAAAEELHILDCYLAVLEARVAAEQTRTAAAELVRARFPKAAYITHKESLQMPALTQPERYPQIVVCCPDKYIVHKVLNGRYGAVVDCVYFEAWLCPVCDGEGRIPNYAGCGDQAGGYAETCDTCKGSGKRVER